MDQMLFLMPNQQYQSTEGATPGWKQVCGKGVHHCIWGWNLFSKVSPWSVAQKLKLILHWCTVKESNTMLNQPSVADSVYVQ